MTRTNQSETVHDRETIASHLFDDEGSDQVKFLVFVFASFCFSVCLCGGLDILLWRYSV